MEGEEKSEEKPKLEGEKIKDQPFDEAIPLTESEDVESDQEEEEEMMGRPELRDAAEGPEGDEEEEDDDEDEQKELEKDLEGGAKPIQPGETAGQSFPTKLQFHQSNYDNIKVPNSYNPADYHDLNVASEVSELFDYIQRYKPHHLELESNLKPFIPEFVPAIGEVDAFLKIPRPDGQDELTGLARLDEPSLNPIDPTVLEMKYLQTLTKPAIQAMEIHLIEDAEKNPQAIQNWISNVKEMKNTQPPDTVSYTKNMPDIESLMQEWPVDMEEGFDNISFPGPEITLPLGEYAKTMCSFLDIPIHKLQNSKSLVEALHVMFTLYNEFKNNPYFGKGADGKRNTTQDGFNYMKVE